MRYNKTLGVAIAAILSGGIGLASADELYNISFDDGVTAAAAPNGVFDPPAEPYASEKISAEGVGGPDSEAITTVFEFQNDTKLEYPLYIDYTLTGADFDTDVLPANPKFANVGVGAVTLASVGLIEPKTNTIRYILHAEFDSIKVASATGTVFNAGAEIDALVFTFTPKNLTGLASNGGTVQLKAEWGYADTNFEVSGSSIQTLYQSTAGVSATFNAKNNPAPKIDVTQGSKKFVDGYSATAITLGTVIIEADPLIYPINDVNTDNDVTGFIVVTGGPFLASTGVNQVFLDIDPAGECVFSPDTNDVAGVVDGDEVTFDLKVEHVDGIVAAGAVDVCVIVDEANDTDINDTEDRANAILSLKYPDSNKSQAYFGYLAQVKRNGTACTLYNVPHKQASDTGYYRFINKTDKIVTVWGALKDRNGIEYFNNQELGTAEPNGTLVVNSDALHDYATANGAAVENPWTGRAILTINSNSTNMEAYALLRGKNTKNVLLPAGVATAPANIGPLINVSAGASGNGCD